MRSSAARASSLALPELVLERLHVHLAIPEPLFLPLEVDELLVDLSLLLADALLDLHDLEPPVLHLGLDLRPELHGLLASLDLRLASDRVRWRSVSARMRRRSASAVRTRERERPVSNAPAATAPTRIPMSAATAVSMRASVEDSITRGCAAGAHTRHPACAAASGPCARASAQAVPPLLGRARGRWVRSSRVSVEVTEFRKRHEQEKCRVEAGSS